MVVSPGPGVVVSPGGPGMDDDRTRMERMRVRTVDTTTCGTGRHANMWDMGDDT